MTETFHALQWLGDDHIQEFVRIWDRMEPVWRGMTESQKAECLLKRLIKSKKLEDVVRAYKRASIDHGPEYTYQYLYRALNNQIKLDEHEKSQADTLVQLNKLATGGRKTAPLASMQQESQVSDKQKDLDKRGPLGAKGKGNDKLGKKSAKKYFCFYFNRH